MTAPAIVMMVVTMLLVWGGLVASIVLLRVIPLPEEDHDLSWDFEESEVPREVTC
ncbi:methionine/alanine import family NSS transporter small subunit [Schaalia sp. lx-100]|uniref:methionine/alanine import family NSS transporter small subunit n=1 Tax=Schaalia sp. lx-100 TaxID=2899081 RepID=UPI001E5783EB|nr:methionine/alanine import family NSS transporter small subunit [Schaalia sp. lx-100]MCD4558214.1 methionine/alanine import family NSS transporter small subunit [Schaalia sp. lx-100]